MTVDATVSAYLAELAAVDRRLVAYPKGAVDSAVNTCGDVAAGALTGEQVLDRVANRFATGANGNWAMPSATAEQVLPIIRRYYCPVGSASPGR